LPLLRYRTGDITTLTDAPCVCGRTTARIARGSRAAPTTLLIVKG